MSRVLKLEATCCNLERGNGTIKINDKRLEEIISEKLPSDLEKYKEYQVGILIEVTVPEITGLSIDTEGYKIDDLENITSNAEREETNE